MEDLVNLDMQMRIVIEELRQFLDQDVEDRLVALIRAESPN